MELDPMIVDFPISSATNTSVDSNILKTENGKLTSNTKWSAKLNKLFDQFMTHPVIEAGKMVARFVPGIGIFMLGVDRLTRWKLVYSKNEPLVAYLERKITDLTTIYIALAELLSPELMRKKHPQLELFNKKALQIKELIDTIQKQIIDFQSKNEAHKLGLAEAIHSQFLSLQKILDELQRDVVLHLSIHNIHHIHQQNSSFDHILSILTQQKTNLESQQRQLNEDLLVLLDRQIKSHEYMDSCIKQMKEDHTPGYAKVSHLEIRKLWFDFFRWPAVIPFLKFIEEVPLYFEMNKDDEAMKVWLRLLKNTKEKRLKSQSFEDIGITLTETGSITAFALNKIFPFDPVYEVKIGDWVIWASLGWIFLVCEIHKQFTALNGKGFFLFPTLISKYLSFVSYLVSNVCSLYDYNHLLHERLKRISIYIRECTSFTPFAERFNMLIISLQDSYVKLESHYQTHVWPDDSETQVILENWIMSQRQLSEIAALLELDVPTWTEKEIGAIKVAELQATERAHTLGLSFANKVCHFWNGQFLLPTNLFSSPVQKLGPKTWQVYFLNAPVILKALEMYPEPMDVVLKNVAVFSTLHLCPHLLQIYGLTFFQDQCYLVMEFAQHGSLMPFLTRNSSLVPKKDVTDSNLNLKLDFCCQVINALLFLNSRNISVASSFSVNSILCMANGVCKLDCLDLLFKGPRPDLYSSTSMTSLHPTTSQRLPFEVKKKIVQLCIEILTETPMPHSEMNPTSLLSEKDWAQHLRKWPMELLQFLFTLTSKPESIESISLDQIYSFFKSCKARFSSPLTVSIHDPGEESLKLKRLLSELFDSNVPIPVIEKELLFITKTNPLAYFYLGDLYYFGFTIRGGCQNFEQAKTWYREAVAKKVAWGHIGLADFAYFGLSDIPQDLWVAELGYSAGLHQIFPEVHPNTVARMYAGLGDVNFDTKQFDMAFDYYQKSIQHNPACSRAWARLGDIYLHGFSKKMDLSEAEMCYRKALNSKRGVEGILALSKSKGTKLSIAELNLELLNEVEY